MKRLKLISIAAIMQLTLLTIQTANAEIIQYFFAVVFDDNSKDFFTVIYTKEIFTSTTLIIMILPLSIFHQMVQSAA